MKNPLHALAGGNYRSNVGDICLNDLELLVSAVLAQILTSADDKTVEHADMPTVSEQTVHQVTPNEATSPVTKSHTLSTLPVAVQKTPNCKGCQQLRPAQLMGGNLVIFAFHQERSRSSASVCGSFGTA